VCQWTDNNLVARRQRMGKSNAINDAVGQSKYVVCNARCCCCCCCCTMELSDRDSISFIILGMALQIDSKLKRLSNVWSCVLFVLSSSSARPRATRALAFGCMISLCAKWNLRDRDIPLYELFPLNCLKCRDNQRFLITLVRKIKPPAHNQPHETKRWIP